jgi:sodium-dependent dicarboxylate transporter 2/3/5
LPISAKPDNVGATAPRGFLVSDSTSSAVSFWRQSLWLWSAIAAFVGVIAMPAPLGMTEPAQRLLAVTTLMTILWVAQTIPMAVTSLIPVVAYPFLAIAPAEQIARAYMNDSILLYVGGFMLAIAIERWGLHRRWALHTVRVMGTGPKRLLLGFMTATSLISMWISNTATTLMMLPIGLALLSAYEACLERDANGEHQSPLTRQRLVQLGAALSLGIAYASSCGGIATYVGTPTNLVFRREWDKLIATTGGDPVSSAEWMMCCMPIAALMTLFAWLVLSVGLKPVPGAERVDRGFFSDRLRELGPPSREEWSVAILFIATACLWVFRLPLEFGETQLLPGWGPPVAQWLVENMGADATLSDKLVTDATVAIAAAILLFVIPAKRHNKNSSGVALLDWKTVEQRLPWGIVLLFGGGFAMADAFGSTGLSEWLGTQLEPLGGLPTIVLVGCVCLMVTFLTEFTSNVATTATLLPILAPLAIKLDLDPRLLMLPATVAASYGFMLPVGTPPNAIAFSSGYVTMRHMVRVGFWINLIGAAVVTLASAWLLGPVLGVEF